MSSPLLIDEPPLQVLPSLAVAVGLNEAIILQQVHYWIQSKRKAAQKYPESFRLGQWWIYNSVPDWNEQFPFWGDNTIRRALASLREQGLLIAAQLADDTRDKTLWYRIDYDKLEKRTALHHAPKGSSKKKEQQKDQSENKWVDASTQNGHMPSTQNGKVHQSKMGTSLSETSSENSQKNLQRGSPASLFQEGEEKTTFAPWPTLSPAEQQPWRDKAGAEMTTAYSLAKTKPSRRVIEHKAQSMYEFAQKGARE